MKKLFSLLAAVLFAGSMMAGSYTITFKDSGTGKDGSSTISTVETIISEGGANVSAIATATNVYNASTGRGIKLGKSKAAGELVMTLAQEVKATSIVVNVCKYSDKEKGFTIQGKEFTADAGDEFTNATYTYENATAINSIALGSTKRIYITSVTVNFEGELAPAAVANYCKTEVGHLMLATPDPNSYVLLSIGSKGGKTIVRVDQDTEKNTAMFDYLQVTGLAQTGEDVAEGGAAAMAVEFDTPALTNDSMTLEILWSTVNWPGRWMVKNIRVAVAECEYAVVPKAPLVPKAISEVYSMAKGAELALNDVTVTYANGKNVYVKDETGSMLLYLTANTTWKAGDKLSGIEGTLDIYNDLYEVKMTAEQVAAVTATAGEAPAPVEFATAPVAADMNKYIIVKNVSVAAGEFKTDKATNLDLIIGEDTVVLRNNFKLAQVFDGDAKYNIVAAVAIYNTTIQLYFISAEEIVVPQLNIMSYGLKASEVADGKVTISYNLNAKATAVEIQLLDAEGAIVKTFDATGLKKGANQEIVDLTGVAAGSYNWAVKATGKTSNAVEPVKVTTVGEASAMSRVVTIDNSYESPYYGNIYAIHGKGVGLYGFSAGLEPLFGGSAVATNGWNPSSSSSPCAAKVSEDGLVYINDWADTNPNVRIFNPATPNVDAKDVFGGTGKDNGIMVNEAGDTIHGSMRYCYPKGTGENTVLYTIDEDYKPDGVTHVYTYNIGNAETPWTAKPSGEGFTHAMTGGKWAGPVDNIAFVPSKEEGGWWIAQHRYADGAAVPSLMHIAGDTLNYFSTGEFANATVGYNNQATLAINNEQSLIVTATNNTKYNILVSEVTWTDNVPTVAVKYTFPSEFAGTCLGLGLDDAGNIYASAQNKPVTIWALPKAENSCVTPAAKASKIVVTDTGTAIDNNFKPVQVQKIIVNGQVLIIKDGKTYNMMGQIVK